MMNHISSFASSEVVNSQALLLSALRSPNDAGSLLSPLSYEGHLSVYSTSLDPRSPPVSSPLSLLSVGVAGGDSDSPSSPLNEGEDESGPPFRCSKCDFVEMSSFEAYKTHVKDMHWNNNSLEEDLEEEEDEDGGSSKLKSSSKSKSLKCKQCHYVGLSKEDFWRHTRDHIKPEKLLSCPQCPFVTEYKHHLEYHLRNHFGSKPFKCRNCSYSCVNKSMLNSHMKSHNNIFQYRCRDCSYATKYCHSLKLHLRKYKHQPDVVLNSDGSVNPLPIIDVYGTRRGPKTKKDDTGNPVIPPFVMAQMQVQSKSQRLSKQPSPVAAVSPFNANDREELESDEGEEEEDEEETPNSPEQQPPRRPYSSPEQQQQQQGRKTVEEEEKEKTPASTYYEYLRNISPFFLQSNNDSFRALLFKTLSGQQQQQASTRDYSSSSPVKPSLSSSPIWENSHVCSFCEVAFKDPIMHTIHMGYHGFSNPFKCNMCGEEAGDKLSFFLHVARKSHA